MKYIAIILLFCFDNLIGQTQVSNENTIIDQGYNLSRIDHIIKENKSFALSHNIKEIYSCYNFNLSQQDTALYSTEKYDEEGRIQSRTGKDYGYGKIRFGYFDIKYLYDKDKKLIEFVKKKSWKQEQEVTKIEYNEQNQVNKVLAGQEVYNFLYYPNGKLKQCNAATNYYDKNWNLIYEIIPSDNIAHDTTFRAMFNENNCCVFFGQKHMHSDSMIVDKDCNTLEMYVFDYNFNKKSPRYLSSKTRYKYENGKLLEGITYTPKNKIEFKIESYVEYKYFDNGLLKSVMYLDKNKKVNSTKTYSYTYYVK